MKKTPAHTVLILAGGQSRRMGRDKGEILIEGERLVDRIISRLQAQVCNIFISGGHTYGLNYRHIPDLANGPGGPAGGIYAALMDEMFRDSSGLGFFTVPVDGPMVPLNLTQRLYSSEHSTIVRDGNGRHPSFGWWRFDDVSRALGDFDQKRSLSLNGLADMCGAHCVDWPGRSNFVNLNTPEDVKLYNEG